jgi:hypothetical protein
MNTHIELLKLNPDVKNIKINKIFRFQIKGKTFYIKINLSYRWFRWGRSAESTSWRVIEIFERPENLQAYLLKKKLLLDNNKRIMIYEKWHKKEKAFVGKNKYVNRK